MKQILSLLLLVGLCACEGEDSDAEIVPPADSGPLTVVHTKGLALLQFAEGAPNTQWPYLNTAITFFSEGGRARFEYNSSFTGFDLGEMASFEQAGQRPLPDAAASESRVCDAAAGHGYLLCLSDPVAFPSGVEAYDVVTTMAVWIREYTDERGYEIQYVPRFNTLCLRYGYVKVAPQGTARIYLPANVEEWTVERSFIASFDVVQRDRFLEVRLVSANESFRVQGRIWVRSGRMCAPVLIELAR